MNKQPKILFWDIETSPIETYAWRLGQTYSTIDNLKKDWYMICACWKFAGQKTIHSATMTKPGDDLELIKKLREVLASADLIVHHYGDAFDLKKFNARLILHKLPPLPDIPTVDTKKAVAKVADMTSNKLEYLVKTTTGIGKIKTDYDLWIRTHTGSKKALREMVIYNKRDVEAVEEWYNWLKPYIKNHPHIWAKYEDRHHTCKNCGSTKLKKNGTRPTKAGILKQEMQCQECGSYHRIPIEKI